MVCNGDRVHETVQTVLDLSEVDYCYNPSKYKVIIASVCMFTGYDMHL